jgi:hypothetical protein
VTRWLLLGLLVLTASARAETAEQLVDKLAQIDCPSPGVSDSATFDGFIADEKGSTPTAMLLTEPRHCLPDAERELVRRGGAALPVLIAHLDDKRPTKLVVGNDPSRKDAFFYMAQYYSDEYDARDRTVPFIACGAGRSCEDSPSFEGRYTLRVSDICFALIGQIVNRRLNAVRYQPTAILMVNSPIETPLLAERVRRDWAGIDAGSLKPALLSDLHRDHFGAADAEDEKHALENTWDGALRRLRFYYPDAYAGLTGSDLQKRQAFETRERRQ